MGSPVDIGKTWMTAVIDAPAFEKIKSYIEYARENYPKVVILAGGKCDAKKGWFIEPTVLEVHTMSIHHYSLSSTQTL